MPFLPKLPLVAARKGALVALAALFVSAACVNVTPPGVFFASQPPGARILLDEVDSGFVTPAMIDLDNAKAYEIRLELQGYEPRTFKIKPGGRVTLVPWYNAVTPESIHFPLFATTEDLFFPLRLDENLVPGRIHVRLHPLGDER